MCQGTRGEETNVTLWSAKDSCPNCFFSSTMKKHVKRRTPGLKPRWCAGHVCFPSWGGVKVLLLPNSLRAKSPAGLSFISPAIPSPNLGSSCTLANSTVPLVFTCVTKTKIRLSTSQGLEKKIGSILPSYSQAGWPGTNTCCGDSFHMPLFWMVQDFYRHCALVFQTSSDFPYITQWPKKRWELGGGRRRRKNISQLQFQPPERHKTSRETICFFRSCKARFINRLKKIIIHI